MKRILILLAAAIMLVGCAPKEEAIIEPTEDLQEINTDENTKENTENETSKMPESILIKGIITEISDGMVTVDVLEGDNNPVIVLKISDETVWDVPMDYMKAGQYIAAEISPAMTRSIPPQSNAIKILGLNDVVLGEVLEISDEQITLKPVNFNNHETLVITLSDETIWDAAGDAISEGHTIRVAIGMAMTLSIPPMTSGVRILSVETHD